MLYQESPSIHIEQLSIRPSQRIPKNVTLKHFALLLQRGSWSADVALLHGDRVSRLGKIAGFSVSTYCAHFALCDVTVNLWLYREMHNRAG